MGVNKYLENNECYSPKNNNCDFTIHNSARRENMRPEHIKDIIWKSVESGKGDRTKYLKVYIRFFSKDTSEFLKEERQPIKNGSKNEFKSTIDNYVFYFDEWEWG